MDDLIVQVKLSKFDLLIIGSPLFVCAWNRYKNEFLLQAAMGWNDVKT